MDVNRSPDRRTMRRRRGDLAEAHVARYLVACGWTILARQLRVGRDEIDILAIDPAGPHTIVVVEVRSRSDERFGTQEEGLDGRKLRCLYRAAATLRVAGGLPDGTPLPPRLWRVDLVAVDLGAAADGSDPVAPRALRHLRGLIPP